VIWVAGRIVRDEELTVSVLDRTFEHGLGLFETLRTWGGKAVLLPRHLDRMRNSSQALGLPCDYVTFPDESAVAALLEAESANADVMLRLTLSGGRSLAHGATLWMRALPLPGPLGHRDGAAVAVGDWPVMKDSLLARHKALNYWERRIAHERAQRLGFDETLSTTSPYTIWEGSRTNVFLIERDCLVTTSTRGPIVPGIMRQLVLEVAENLPIGISQTELLTYERLRDADEVFLTNSVRGIVPVGSVNFCDGGAERGTRWSAPGPWTQRLSLLVADRLKPPGGRPV